MQEFDWTAWDSRLCGFIERNHNLVGKVFAGRKIFSPSEIKDWYPFFVIVATTHYYNAVKAELTAYHLEEGKDFCYWKDLCEE